MFVDLSIGEWLTAISVCQKNKRFMRGGFWGNVRKYFECSENPNITAQALIWFNFSVLISIVGV